MSYARFGAMIRIDPGEVRVDVLNTSALDHVFYSQTRAWMAIVMGTAMAIVMLLFMWGMYANRRANIAIVTVSVLAAAGLYGWCEASRR